MYTLEIKDDESAVVLDLAGTFLGHKVPSFIFSQCSLPLLPGLFSPTRLTSPRLFPSPRLLPSSPLILTQVPNLSRRVPPMIFQHHTKLRPQGPKFQLVERDLGNSCVAKLGYR
jgi:hypothetical protein